MHAIKAQGDWGVFLQPFLPLTLDHAAWIKRSVKLGYIKCRSFIVRNTQWLKVFFLLFIVISIVLPQAILVKDSRNS
jgi:hypothetical protein